MSTEEQTCTHTVMRKQYFQGRDVAFPARCGRPVAVVDDLGDPFCTRHVGFAVLRGGASDGREAERR